MAREQQYRKGPAIYVGLQNDHDPTMIFLTNILGPIKGHCSMSEAEESHFALFSFGETSISTASCFEYPTLKYRQVKETPERLKIRNEGRLKEL